MGKAKGLVRAVALSLLVHSAACTADEADVNDPPAERIIEPVSWRADTVLGGLPDDTLLSAAGPMASDLRGVFIADMFNGKVVHVDTTGTVEWTAGRKGAGPEEFSHIVDLKVGLDGELWVLDAGNSRVSIIDSTGQFASSLRLSELPGRPIGMLPNGDDLWILATTADSPLIRLRGGRIAGSATLPWDSARAIHPLAGQLTTAADIKAGVLYMAYQLGNGVMSFGPATERGRRAAAIEPVPFPNVSVSRSGNAVSTEVEGPPTFAARAVSYSDGEVHVHFGGRTDHRLAVIDVYDGGDLQYVRSYRLPRRVNRAVVVGRTVYAEFSDPYPVVVRYTPENEP